MNQTGERAHLNLRAGRPGRGGARRGVAPGEGRGAAPGAGRGGASGAGRGAARRWRGQGAPGALGALAGRGEEPSASEGASGKGLLM